MIKERINDIFKNTDYSELLQKGSSALFIRILGFISGFFYLYFVVKFFGVETNGLLSLSFSVMIIGSLISRLGIDINLTKIFAISNNHNNSKGIFYKTIPIISIISITIAIVVFLFANQISIYVFNEPKLEPFLKWTSPTILLFSLLLINASVLRGLRKNSIYSFLFNGGRFFLTIIVFFVFYYIFNYKQPIISIQAHTIGIFILFIISVFYVLKSALPISIKSEYKTKSFIKESLPMLISASVIVLLGWSDTLILGIFKESKTVGVYNIVIKISTLTSFTFQALDSILAPKLSKSYHDDNMSLFKKLVRFSTKINTVISLIIVLAIIIFRNFILSYFGPEAIIGSITLIILSLGQLVNSICGPVGSILQMTGNQKVFQNILFIALLLNIILNLILVKPYGMMGVGISTAVSLLFWNVTCVIYINNVLKINIFKG